MSNPNLHTVTPYPDINDLLQCLTEEVSKILSTNLVGIYLFGSLTYDAFLPDRSDIDIVVIVKKALNSNELIEVKKLHEEIQQKFPQWANRLEVSYTPLSMFTEVLPPKQPRPYFGAGIFYPEAQYGNEWIINNYLLYESGVVLAGPEIKTLISKVKIHDVQVANIRDLHEEWQPKMMDLNYLDDSHQQSYVVLNLCRILHTAFQHFPTSKQDSADWVKTQFPEWVELITIAEHWKYGLEMDRKEETRRFLQFTIQIIDESTLPQ